eukprot:11206148-Lingulodinium_polyedra.AAC.1
MCIRDRARAPRQARSSHRVRGPGPRPGRSPACSAGSRRPRCSRGRARLAQGKRRGAPRRPSRTNGRPHSGAAPAARARGLP